MSSACAVIGRAASALSVTSSGRPMPTALQMFGQFRDASGP